MRPVLPLALLAVFAACGGETTPGASSPPGSCCCEFIVEGDIIKEDLLLTQECSARESGQCIQVDPNRFTPHPCCPDSPGPRCGS